MGWIHIKTTKRELFPSNMLVFKNYVPTLETAVFVTFDKKVSLKEADKNVLILSDALLA